MGNCLYKDIGAAIGRDASQALILVVGNDAECKSRVAWDLAEARGATEMHLNKAGVLLFARKHSPAEPVVMDTAPLKTVPGLSRLDTARVWISQNSLRQLSGQVVFVVCVISSTDAKDEIYRDPNFRHNQFSWLHVLAYVFEKNRKEILILVKSEDSTDNPFKQRFMQVLKRDGFGWHENIIFVKSKRTDLNNPMVKRKVHPSVDRDNVDHEKSIEKGIESMSPFRLPMVALDGADQFGPWGPENVILFGMSGSGKSTLAKMLTTGRLDGVDSLSTKFSTSSGLRGETKKVIVGQGRGWRVVDTPGVGESNEDAKSGVSTDRAGKLIRDYVTLVQGVFSHFIFVMKMGRVSETDTALWRIFNKMFHEDGVRNHKTVVITGADQSWVDCNISHLKNCFEGCHSFLPAEFPSMEPDVDCDEEAERELQEELQNTRLQSLKALEEDLASLCRPDASCRLGMWSLGTQRSLIARGEEESSSIGTHYCQNSAFGWLAVKPQPSDYETFRTINRINSFISPTFLPGQKLDLKSFTSPSFLPGRKLDLSQSEGIKKIKGTADKYMIRDGTPETKLLTCFIGLIKDRDDDGYFVSSEWLLSLQDNQRESLMSVLQGAGYAEACQTRTTTLFARIGSDGEGPTSTEAPGSFISTGKKVDNLPRDWQGFNMDKNAEISNQEIANASDADNQRESSSATDDRRRRQVATWESFQAAIKSKCHQRFCVSTQWLYDLNQHEKEALVQSLSEAKYVQISQTRNTTWYVRFQVGNLPGSAGDGDSSSSSNKNNSPSGNVKNLGRWNSFGWLRPKKSVNGEDNAKGSSGAENGVETSKIQDGKISVCHPQRLTVTCSSSSERSTVPQLNGDLSEYFSRNRFGDSIVTIPRIGPSHNISTSMEKPFPITKIEFVDGRSREASMDLKAIATTSMSCCVKLDSHLVHVKFSKISGEAKNVQPEEEWCNAVVVSAVYTTVFGCSKRTTDTGSSIEQIDLSLDDEYCRSGGRIVSEGDPSTGDLVWMEHSERTPDRCEPGSTTLVLRREVERRRLEDSKKVLQGAYPLHFQRPSPVIFNGEANLTHQGHPDSYLQFIIRYQLQVSYFEPSRAILEEGLVWYAINKTKLIDFGCSLTITT